MKKHTPKSFQAELLRAYMDVKDKILPVYDFKSGDMIYVIPQPRENDTAPHIKKRMTREELAKRLGTTTSNIQKWRIGERPIPLDLVPEIEKILDIPQGQLEYKDNLLSKSLQVIQALNELDILSLYLIDKNYNAYLDIGEVAWDFICTYSRLNSNGKMNLKHMAYQMQTDIEFQLLKLKKIAVYMELRDTSKQQYEKQCNREEKQKLLNKLKKKVGKASLLNYELLLSQIKHNITMLEVETWDMLISFMLLGQLIHYSSEKQQKLIEAANSFVAEEKYLVT